MTADACGRAGCPNCTRDYVECDDGCPNCDEWYAGMGIAWSPTAGPHTRAVETSGNAYCVECSAAIQAWVAYPCRDWLDYETEGVGTGAGEGATGQDTGTAWVTRSEDCPEAPAQAHPLAYFTRTVRTLMRANDRRARRRLLVRRLLGVAV